ncbi:hypothetical protein J2I47_09520 [Fibrella sp. HMF5335]|uniref:Uncharacterized protein n=1 Tax=Fibrella rubiginis TaxID=2817060 RepID=A0A939GHA6_9BACT|nr:hypothetical protein [Fibrella rubiginis]MBO0936780.1 hypothetical protein [Fibrella rubiginis]
MEPINRAERSASLFNFILVYALITAIPVGITYQIAKKSGGSSLNQKAVSEQQTLAKEMSALQAYVKRMEEIDAQRPAETASSETWSMWLQAAEKQNSDFKGRVDLFQRNNLFTGARLTMRDNACSYLYRINIERRNYLAKRSALVDIKNNADDVSKVKAENAGLKEKVDNLNTQIATINAIKDSRAPAIAAGGGGGGDCKKLEADVKALEDELDYKEAVSKKMQADMLAFGNEMTKRRQLYAASKAELEKLSTDRKFTRSFKLMATEKIGEIDRTLMALNGK